MYSLWPSTLSCYEALIHRLSCSYSRQCTDCFFLQSQLTVLSSSSWTFTSLVHSLPHSCIETCAHSSWLLWCLTGVLGCTEARYLLAGRWIWLNSFVDPLESQSSSPDLVDQLSFYYPAMDMVKWRTLSLFSWLLLSFCISLRGLPGLSLCLTIFLGTFFITPFCSGDNLLTHACGALTFTFILLFP